MTRLLCLAVLALQLAGCASSGKVDNRPLSVIKNTSNYSLRGFQNNWQSNQNALILAFSGGGTRAAALSYGVLKELRDIRVKAPQGETRLLDEIHSISSVSGGSFTAAYFGLHGDRIFEDYEEVFLRQNVQGALVRRLLNPFRWFSSTGRTEMAIKYYEKTVFEGATFADLLQNDGPMIVINASDFARGVRFSFIQDYFDPLCSDLSSFPVSRAVAASSAVPILFNPVVVENFGGCGASHQDWLAQARERVNKAPELLFTVDGLASYADHEQRRYLHLVDGGIADNLGLRAFYEIVEVSGGITEYLQQVQRAPPRRVALISVNAAADPQSTMDQTTKQPSVAESLSAMSDVQLNRYSVDTIALMKNSLQRWAKELSTEQQQVEAYFIMLDFNGIQDSGQRDLLNQTPTSFSLTDDQVDGLIAAGGELLRNNPEFQRLMVDVRAEERARSADPDKRE